MAEALADGTVTGQIPGLTVIIGQTECIVCDDCITFGIRLRLPAQHDKPCLGVSCLGFIQDGFHAAADTDYGTGTGFSSTTQGSLHLFRASM